MKLASIVLTVFLLAGSAFPTTSKDPLGELSKGIKRLQAVAESALGAVDEYNKMAIKLAMLGDPEVNKILADGLPKVQAKLAGK